MKKIVRFSGTYDTLNFVKNAYAVEEGDVTVKHGRYIVDGKSILSMLNIDASNGVVVEYPDDAKAFTEYLNSL